MAPEYCEFMRDKSDFPTPTPAVDLWSLGCVVYELFTKQRPFCEDSRYFRIYCADPRLPEDIGSSCASFDAQDMLANLLQPRPELRITAEEALAQPWLVEDTPSIPQEPLSTSDNFEHGFEKLHICVTAPDRYGASPASTYQHLHSTASSVSLATTSTLVDESYESDCWFDRSQNSTPKPPQPPLRPPQLPARGAPLRTVSAPMTGTSSPISACSTPPHASIESFLPQVNESDSERPPMQSHRQHEPHPPQLPPRRRQQKPLDMPTPTQQRSASYESSFSGSSARSEQSLPRAPEPITNLHVVQSWFRCSLNHQQLSMDFGPLPCYPGARQCCDLCDQKFRLAGKAPPSATQVVLYLCEKCGGRVLCERCARDSIDIVRDFHEPDHLMRRIGPAFSFPFEKFIAIAELKPTLRGRLPVTFGDRWLSSDHGFRPPSEMLAVRSQVQLSLASPPGKHQVVVCLRIAFAPDMVTSDAIGTTQKKWMKMSKAAYGYISVGAETLGADPEHYTSGPAQFLPMNHVEQQILREKGQNDCSIILCPKDILTVEPGQSVSIVIRASYDPLIFKNGCPFHWYLDHVDLSSYGPKQLLATMGQLRMREQQIMQQRKIEKEHQNQRRMSYLNGGINTAKIAYGLAGSVAQFGANRMQKKNNELSAINNYVGAMNGLSAYHGSSAGSSMGDPYQADEYASTAGYGVASDTTQEWVSSQAASEPFIASAEYVEYSAGTHGTTSASLMYWGTSTG